MHGEQKMNVTQLAEFLPEKSFKTVKVKSEAFTLYGLEVWMPMGGTSSWSSPRRRTASSSTLPTGWNDQIGRCLKPTR